MLLQIVDAATDSTATGQTEVSIPVMRLLLDGGWVMIPLLILSILAVYIFVERFLAIQKAGKEDPNFMNQIRDYVLNGNIDSAKALCANTEGPFARMIGKGIKRIGKPLNDISAAIENDGKLEIYRLESKLASLATIAGAAPMIGFLGTVIGMIVTFHNMAQSSNVDITGLSGGIMQAMVTTAAGLVVGIVAYIGYNMLVARVEKVIHKMEATSIEFMDLLQDPA